MQQKPSSFIKNTADKREIGGVPIHVLHSDEDSTPIFSYVRTSEVPEDQREEFVEWLSGQTRPIIPILGKDQDAAYSWDYETWLSRAWKGLPYLWD